MYCEVPKKMMHLDAKKIVICESWNNLEQDLMHDSCKQTPQDSWRCGSAAEHAKIQGWKSSDTLPKRIIIEFIQLRCVSAIIDVAVLPVRILLIFAMSWFLCPPRYGLQLRGTREVLRHATTTGMAQALPWTQLLQKSIRFFSLGNLSVFLKVGLLQVPHIPSTFHPHFILISSIVHAYSYSFLENELIFIGGMKSGEQISSFFHIPCIFSQNRFFHHRRRLAFDHFDHHRAGPVGASWRRHSFSTLHGWFTQ